MSDKRIHKKYKKDPTKPGLIRCTECNYAFYMEMPNPQTNFAHFEFIDFGDRGVRHNMFFYIETPTDIFDEVLDDLDERFS